MEGEEGELEKLFLQSCIHAPKTVITFNIKRISLDVKVKKHSAMRTSFIGLEQK